MKSLARIFLLLLFTGVSTLLSAQTAKKYTLRDAIAGGYVSTKLMGTGGFTGDVIELEVENLTEYQIEIEIEAGRKLCPKDTTLQTLIVTKEMIVRLQPKEKKHGKLFAMCGQAHDGAPASGDKFRFGPMANGNVRGLAKMISEKDAQNRVGQWAMWCMTDGYDPNSMPGNDSLLKVALVNYIVGAKAKPADTKPEVKIEDLPEYMRPGGGLQKEEDVIPFYTIPHKSAFETFKKEDEQLPEYMRFHNTKPADATVSTGNPNATYTISAEVSVNVPTNHDVSIIVIDENGKLLKKISSYANPTPGMHKYSYKVTDPNIRGIVYVRVMQFGNVLKQVKYDLH